jgi:hypothetical protein
MKKITFIALVAITSASLVSCSSPEKKLISGADDLIQKEFVPKLNDPHSFEKGEVMIYDTIDSKAYHLKQAESYFKDVTGYVKDFDYEMDMEGILHDGSHLAKAKDILAREKEFKRMGDSCLALSKKESNGPRKIEYIDIAYNYRAKNGFGALISDRAIVRYFPEETDEKKKYMIYSSTSKD